MLGVTYKSFTLSVILQSVVMLSVILLCVIMLSVMVPSCLSNVPAMSTRVKSLLALTGNIRLVVKFLKVTIVKLSNRGDFLVSVDVYCQILNNRYKCNNGVL